MQTILQKRVLCDRISRQQKMKMLELIHQHPELGRGSLKKIETVDLLWQKFTRLLNSNMGARKKPGQWKRSWIDWKASVKRQFAALVAYEQGNWTRQEAPKPIDPMDLEVVEYITNLPPECNNYDVYVLNDSIKKLVSKSPVDPMEFTNDRDPVFDDDTTIKQEEDEVEFDNSHAEVLYENEKDDTEFQINFLEEPSCSNSTFLAENNTHNLPPLHPIGGPIVHNKTNRTDYLLEELLKEQRKTNDLLQKTLNLLINKK